jgi:hypothetical protein
VSELAGSNETERLKLLKALMHDLEVMVRATVGCDETALEGCLRRVRDEVEEISTAMQSQNVVVSAAEAQLAVGVRNSVKNLARLVERIRAVQNARLRTIGVYEISGYAE